MTTALYVILMAALMVAIDFLFFENRFWERLMVNVGIVFVFAAFYVLVALVHASAAGDPSVSVPPGSSYATAIRVPATTERDGVR